MTRIKRFNENTHDSISESILPELSKDAIEALEGIGGFAALTGIAYGFVKMAFNQSKKEIIQRFKKAGKEIPDEKTLDKLAAKSLHVAMDRATGNGDGADTPDIEI